MPATTDAQDRVLNNLFTGDYDEMHVLPLHDGTRRAECMLNGRIVRIVEVEPDGTIRGDGLTL
jgi:hypothetical protein